MAAVMSLPPALRNKAAKSSTAISPGCHLEPERSKSESCSAHTTDQPIRDMSHLWIVKPRPWFFLFFGGFFCIFHHCFGGFNVAVGGAVDITLGRKTNHLSRQEVYVWHFKIKACMAAEINSKTIKTATIKFFA